MKEQSVIKKPVYNLIPAENYVVVRPVKVDGLRVQNPFLLGNNANKDVVPCIGTVHAYGKNVPISADGKTIIFNKNLSTTVYNNDETYHVIHKSAIIATVYKDDTTIEVSDEDITEYLTGYIENLGFDEYDTKTIVASCLDNIRQGRNQDSSKS